MPEVLRTKEGHEQYSEAQTDCEPVFGIIKSMLGFRRFPLCGLLESKRRTRLGVLDVQRQEAVACAECLMNGAQEVRGGVIAFLNRELAANCTSGSWVVPHIQGSGQNRGQPVRRKRKTTACSARQTTGLESPRFSGTCVVWGSPWMQNQDAGGTEEVKKVWRLLQGKPNVVQIAFKNKQSIAIRWAGRRMWLSLQVGW